MRIPKAIVTKSRIRNSDLLITKDKSTRSFRKKRSLLLKKSSKKADSQKGMDILSSFNKTIRMAKGKFMGKA